MCVWILVLLLLLLIHHVDGREGGHPTSSMRYPRQAAARGPPTMYRPVMSSAGRQAGKPSTPVCEGEGGAGGGTGVLTLLALLIHNVNLCNRVLGARQVALENCGLLPLHARA